jgi:hypothetical protein
MKTTRKTVARLLPLLAILAVLPFAVWSCEDAGDEPDGPTGPYSQYNPELDTPGAAIKVSVKGDTFPGGEFDLMARFTDGDGRAVQGVPLTAQAETGAGNVVKYFTFDVNPSITSAQGHASIHVRIAADCPQGSYQFMVYSAPADSTVAPYARGYAGIKVGEGGVSTVTGVSVIAGPNAVTQFDAASYVARVTTTAGCTPEVQFNFGAGLVPDAGGDLTEGTTWNFVGTFYVRVQARCGTDSWVESDPYPVVVSAP